MKIIDNNPLPTAEQFPEIHKEGVEAAKKATAEWIEKHGDNHACGFVWIKVFDVRGNSRLGKAMKAEGFDKAYGGGLQLWNPSGSHVQSAGALDAGAEAYVDVLREHGFQQAYAQSRLD